MINKKFHFEKRYFLNNHKAVVVFDQKPLLVEKNDLDEQIAKLLIANWSYITYLERKLGYYNDDTDSLIWAKILNVKLKKKS